MPATYHDFVIEQGSSFKVILVYKDNLEQIVDLTGWCARLTWLTNKGDSYTFNNDNTNTSEYKFIIDGPTGTLILMIPASTTNDYLFNTAKYDLELKSPNDLYFGGGKYTIRILYGNFNILKRNSKSTTELDCA